MLALASRKRAFLGADAAERLPLNAKRARTSRKASRLHHLKGCHQRMSAQSAGRKSSRSIRLGREADITRVHKS